MPPCARENSNYVGKGLTDNTHKGGLWDVERIDSSRDGETIGDRNAQSEIERLSTTRTKEGIEPKSYSGLEKSEKRAFI